MTKDRMKDLEKETSWPDVSYRRLSRQCVDHEEQSSVYDNQPDSIVINIDNQSATIDFLHETIAIRSTIDQIDELSQRVKRIHIETLSSPNSKLTEEFDDKTKEIKKLANDMATRLKAMEQAPINLKETNAQRRIREAQVFVLTRRFRDTMIQYNKDTVSLRERCKKSIVRELEIAGDRRTDDEIERMLEDGPSKALNSPIFIFTQKARQTLDDLEARHRDIIKLEQSIVELHSMYHDLAMLVDNQGEMINSIEYNIEKSTGYVHDAAENVNTADLYRQKGQKKKIVVLILLTAGVCLVITIVLITYFTQKKIRGR